MRPNIVLVVFDTARADAFGADGSTPVAADLARRGGSVPLAIAPANWTMPSHASMFTGKLPRALGLSRPLEGPILLNPRAVLERHADRLLAEVLRRAGYATAGVSCNPMISRAAGFATGFERWQDVASARVAPRAPGMRDRARFFAQAVAARVDEGARDAGRFLRSVPTPADRPFFWFVNLMECHSPYLPARPFNDLSPVGRFRAALDAYRFQEATRMALYTLGRLEIPESSISRMRHLYRRAVTMMDHWMGGLLEHLDRRGVLDDTVVIVTSDHGENIGEDHLLGHSRSLDQRLIHVPFVMAGPMDPPPEPMFGLTDLPAFIGERLGLEGHPWSHREIPQGTCVAQNDLTSFWSDEQIERLARTLNLPEEAVREPGPYAAILDGRFKLYRVRSSERLFDLDADPMETRDVSGQFPDRAAQLRGQLDRVQADVGDASPAAFTPSEEAEIRDRLEALGYL